MRITLLAFCLSCIVWVLLVYGSIIRLEYKISDLEKRVIILERMMIVEDKDAST